MAASQVPFPWISDLPLRAQRELERNFFELQRQIVGAATPFDALIDSELAASLPGQHQYKNLTDLLANETWDSTRRLNVAVRQGKTAITETGSTSTAGKRLALFGIGSNELDSTPAWLWSTIGGSSSWVTLQGLNIDASSNTAIANGGILTAIDCWFGSHITGFNWAGISGQSGEAWNCTFAGALTAAGSIGVGTTAKLFNCNCTGGITLSSQVDLHLYGGVCSGLTIGTTSTNSQIAIADFSGGSVTVTSCGGSVYIQNTANTAGGTFTLTACSGDCTVIGNFTGTVAFNAVPTSGQKFSWRGTAAGLTTAGGVHAQATLGTAFTSGRLQVGGKNNVISAQFNKFTNPAVKFVAATHSLVMMSMLDVGGPGLQAYTFDASSTNNILILAGSLAAGFTTASTDAGSNNLVITEHLLSTMPLTNTHIFVGNASNIATDVAMSGDATIANTGAVTLANSGVTAATYGDATHVTQVTFDAKGRATSASSVAISGAGIDTTAIHTGDTAGGDLSGTYPNPAVFQAHLTDQSTPATPSSGTAILFSFSQQGFSVPHILDSTGAAMEILRDNVFIVRNVTGSTINKGTPVYVSGATGAVPQVTKADATDHAKQAVGVLFESIANNAYGRCMSLGNIEAIDLSAYVDGDLLYLDPATPGTLTTTRPTAPNYSQQIGWVLNNGVGNGVLFVDVKDHANKADEVVVDASGFAGNLSAADTSTQHALATIDGLALSGAPVGGIIMWGTGTAPSGWLLCDGASYLRATYPALFAVIGTTFGAADGTHFNVPDMGAQSVWGYKSGTNNINDKVGATTHSHGVGTLANASSTVSGIAGTNSTSTVSGIAGTVSAHAHNLSSAGWADVSMASGVGIVMRRLTVTAYNDTHLYTATGQSITAETVSRSSGTELNGATDSATPTWTQSGTATAAAQTWTQSGTATAAAQTISGSTANATGPIDPATVLAFIIKT